MVRRSPELVTTTIYLVLQGFVTTVEGIYLGDQFLFTLHSESLCTTFKKCVLLFSGFFENTHTCFLTLLDVRSDLNIILLELSLDQLQVLVETVPELTQTLIDLSLDLFLQPIGKHLVSFVHVFVTLENRFLEVCNL